MKTSQEQARLHVSPFVFLRKAALTGLAVIAVAACVPASAEFYTITTRTTGTNAGFFLDGLFPQGEINGNFSYELTVTSAFSSNNVTSSIDRHWMRANDAALDVALKVDNRLFTFKTVGTVNSVIHTDTDGDGRTIKRFYNTISFDPATKGDYATIDQYVFLAADQFAINSVLENATGYYADPLTKGFSIYNSNVNPNGTLDPMGDAAGRANTFEYNLVAVPEPTTWGMLGAGLAVVGFAGRRRRQPAMAA
ncbi:putative secreted protein with PEP-CTERM sorting signal [Pseudoduganella lurida]|uniref:Putative secreted protein with PEP-CTERM sorting signal n=1 Tax=Pseudoduganella lurida TaxID=1036180 RepID=A0A562R092_9BURK|nr:PEP-CTERM sorting domain-containing protein [Pseudoduganella lurida]TWI62481.1 putative secreted protein with PEP-CTERM sorting signal [Pseudoduganella lurida]